MCGIAGVYSPARLSTRHSSAPCSRRFRTAGQTTAAWKSSKAANWSLDTCACRSSTCRRSGINRWQRRIRRRGSYSTARSTTFANFAPICRVWDGCSAAIQIPRLFSLHIEPGGSKQSNAFTACLHLRSGMLHSRVLHLCRDRFGVKPLYFGVRDGRLIFASEMKALIYGGFSARSVDSTSVAEFVQYGYISAPRSIFADVQTVRPGTICTFDARLERTEHCYWSAKALYDGEHATALRAELAGLSDEELLERTERTLRRAFTYRMVADVPVGIFLSGGIDSSLVTALLAKSSSIKLRTFTIGFARSEFDESPYARAVAQLLNTEHVEFDVSPQMALQSASDITDIADEPIGDSSLIPTLMVSRLARQYVKVALSADGADELFGGYARYAYCGRFVARSAFVRSLYSLSSEILDALPQSIVARAYAVSRGGGPRYAAINDKLRKFVRMSKSKSEFDAYDSVISEWPGQKAHALLAHASVLDEARSVYRSVDGVDPRDRFMHFDMTRYLPGDLLVKVDRASMATSLEAREPFLDQEAAALAAALPMKWKIRGTENKYILRRLLRRHLPPALFERPKQGFSAPIGEWLRGPMRPLLLEHLSIARVKEYGILDPHVADQATRDFLAGDPQCGSAASMWILLQLQQWAGRWLRQTAKC